jgi:2-hydroxy-3-oxopropionate reductase
MRFCVNVSILFTEVPLLERFARARDAGFDAVELWWPRGEDLDELRAAIADAGVDVVLLNFDAGDMPAGDRGLISDPAMQQAFCDNVPVALELADAVGCRMLNALAGHELPGVEREEQLELARRNVRFAADAARAQGAQVLIEAVNTYENGRYLLPSTQAASDFVRSVGREGVRLQYDAYHMQRMEGDLTATIERHIGEIAHVQIADSPGRGQPGTGEINFDYVLRRLAELGYDGHVGLEYKAPGGDTEESLEWLPRELRGAARARERKQPMPETVGFIGLGVMGAPMARNLVEAGHPLVVHNRSREPVDALAAAGAEPASSAREVAERAGIVITMLPDSPAVEDVVLGEDGVLDAASDGDLLIDMSTIHPTLSVALARAGRERGVGVLDAPVSGGDAGAREGALSIMVGGEEADLERARPLLDVLGKTIIHVGGPGAGQVVKACNQVVVAVTIAAVSEALVLGSKAGVEPERILDVLGGGLAANRVMEMRRDNFLEHDFTPGFRIDLHHKDLDIALESGAAYGVPLAVTALVQQHLRALRAKGHGATTTPGCWRSSRSWPTTASAPSAWPPRAEEAPCAA